MKSNHDHHYNYYGQVVVGPCGSGKTTYCDGMQQYLQLLGRNAVVVNLDPANNHFDMNNNNNDDDNNNNTNTALPYTAIYDICSEAVNLKSVMQQMKLGPNGALIYCMEYIELHADEIIESILSRSSSSSTTAAAAAGDTTTTNPYYYIFDFPGQIELYTHSTCVQSILYKLTTQYHMKLTAVQLIDSLYCTDVTKFLSATLLGTTTMIRLELPIVNVLSKIDLLSTYGETSSSSILPLPLDYYTECYDLQRLVPFLDHSNIPHSNDDETTTAEEENDEDEYNVMDDPEYRSIIQKRQSSKFAKQHMKLHYAIAEIVEDYNLLSFLPLDITNAESVGRILAQIDKCNGYLFSNSNSFTTTSTNNIKAPKSMVQPLQDLFHCAVQHDIHYDALADIRERIASPESIRELRKKR